VFRGFGNYTGTESQKAFFSINTAEHLTSSQSQSPTSKFAMSPRRLLGIAASLL